MKLTTFLQDKIMEYCSEHRSNPKLIILSHSQMLQLCSEANEQANKKAGKRFTRIDEFQGIPILEKQEILNGVM